MSIRVSNVTTSKMRSLQGSLLFLSAALLASGTARAEDALPSDISTVLEEIQQYSSEQGQTVQGASKFRDVRPTDWAFQALDDLIKRYDCLVGYPDGTFRGNRPLTRYEFAAGLNACLNQIERLIGSATNLVTREDLEILRRLLQEFETELASLGARVDNLEARTVFLEDHQFSTTTKLVGEVSMGLTSLFSGDDFQGNDLDEQTLFGARSRLEFHSSFSGKDTLMIRLQANGLGNFNDVTGTPEGSLGIATGTGNSLGIDALNYRFPLGDNTSVFVAAAGATTNDIANTITPFDGSDGATLAPSYFATRNSVYYIPNGAGIGIQHAFSDFLEVSAGYFASEANDPGPGKGLFNGPYGLFGQITVNPTENITLAFAYANGYNNDPGVGSNRANLRSFVESQFGASLPISSNTYTALASFQINPGLILGGWVGYTTTRTLAEVEVSDPLGTGTVTLGRGDYRAWNWAAMAAFPDLGKEGSMGGLIFGMEPKVTGATSNINDVIGTDPSTSFHIEGFYQYPINDNISITPAIMWLTAPDHNASNNDILIGIIRTTFSF
ncbi:iron uptake porin [Oscillatoria sp. FACHB-1406]|uniref:iron uptake porin n=1 Tax=Oscillatoria sp. FACHB-1406 TaxID=2692846 RepID=UPI001685908E|nr:iron uptake porin [Oscillatoria sp. FACHB-1406]MBD2576801.1 carbohydrate porin [Oscillatoria sp. FACHB-1406]